MKETVCEQWSEHPKFSGYYFSTSGKAGRKLATGKMRILIGCSAGDGYRAISPPIGGGRYGRIYIHRGVCEVFIGPCPPGMECRHLDGDKTNNSIENLRWGTPIENTNDKRLHGTVASGEANGTAKLTSAAVREMRRVRSEDGISYKSLANKFGVSTMTAYRATVGQSWK